MTLSDEIGNIGNAEYFWYKNKKVEPTKDYDEVVQLKDVKQAIKELKQRFDGYTNYKWAFEEIEKVFGKELCE